MGGGWGVRDLVFRKDNSSKDLNICSGFIAVHVALNYCLVFVFGKAVNMCRWAKIRYSVVCLLGLLILIVCG